MSTVTMRRKPAEGPVGFFVGHFEFEGRGEGEDLFLFVWLGVVVFV